MDRRHLRREGYGANQVAAEQAMLDSGCPVTVVRARKLHGQGAACPREWMFTKRALDARSAHFVDLGSTPVETEAQTVPAEIAWLLFLDRVGFAPGTSDPSSLPCSTIQAKTATSLREPRAWRH